MINLTRSTGVGANRRDFLKSSAAALGGMALPGLSFRRAIGAVDSTRPHKAVLFVLLGGGPSHLDMYDLKPDASAEIRGEFRPVNTNVPGMRVCEHLPLHARIADKFAIVNGVETIDTHGPVVLVTGSACSADGARRTFGEIAEEYDRGEHLSDVHEDLPDQSAIGSFLDGLEKGLERGNGVSLVLTRSLPHNNPWGNWDCHGRVFGSHYSIFEQLRDKLPRYDSAIHRLITGIYDRGFDQDVLLVAWGEFGRTPWINQYGGRDHWAPCGSVLFAGGGLKMGQVIGDTGPIGERERSRSQPYTAQNVLAMVYRHLGINPSTTTFDRHGRNVQLLDDPRPIAELI